MTNEYEIGFSSVCEDGKHILLWDFDIKNIGYFYKIKDILLDIQKGFKLSTIYVIRSRNGFHAICLDKCDKREAFHIKSMTRFNDNRHNLIGSKRDSWVLRIGEDKRIIEILKAKSTWQKSNAHREFLNKFYGLNILDNDNYDRFDNLKFEQYKRRIADIKC